MHKTKPETIFTDLSIKLSANYQPVLPNVTDFQTIFSKLSMKALVVQVQQFEIWNEGLVKNGQMYKWFSQYQTGTHIGGRNCS